MPRLTRLVAMTASASAPGSRKSTALRVGSARPPSDGGEEHEDDDRDDDRDQDVLAAPRGQAQLHPGLGERRRGRERAAHAGSSSAGDRLTRRVRSPRPARGSAPRASRRRPQIDDQPSAGAPGGERGHERRRPAATRPKRVGRSAAASVIAVRPAARPSRAPRSSSVSGRSRRKRSRGRAPAAARQACPRRRPGRGR